MEIFGNDSFLLHQRVFANSGAMHHGIQQDPLCLYGTERQINVASVQIAFLLCLEVGFSNFGRYEYLWDLEVPNTKVSVGCARTQF